MRRLSRDGEKYLKKFEILSWGMENDRYIKIISIIGFITILLVLIIIVKTPPASGYENSIYEVYPYYMWIILAITFARFEQLAEAGRRFVE